MTILNSSLLVYCIGCYFITNGTVYTVIVILTYFSLGAFYGLMPTQVVRIVGEKYGTIIYPFVFIAFTLAAIIQFSFHEAVIRNMGNDGFKIAFIIFGIFQAFSLIFVQVFKF